MFLKSSIMALAMAGTALVATNAQAQNYNNNNRNRPAITIGFGDVAMGYRDGYTGNDHNWHRWQHRNDYVSYRSHHRGQYHDWNHDRGQR
jgi:hypothetical protein